MDKKRTTQEVINTLGKDCDRCHDALIASIDNGKVDEHGNVDAEYEFHARQLIRAIFAYIEAVTFSMKAWSAGYCIDNEIEITPQERYFATDTEYELNEKGEIIETSAKISLAKNIRFTIAINRKAIGIDQSFDASTEWWCNLKQAIRIRDRLTHPKMPEDLDISGKDIITVLKAKAGFEDEALRHTTTDLNNREIQ